LEKYKWEDILGMKLKESHGVCALHFNECDIISSWNIGLNNHSAKILKKIQRTLNTM